MAVLRRAQLGTGALVVAALAVGQLLNDQLPEPSNGGRLFAQEAEVGDTVPMRTGDLTVYSVEGATSILRDLGASIRSPGLVLVVKFTFVPSRESTGISYATFTGGDGRVTTFSTYGSRNEVNCPAGPVGIRSNCVAVVEVAPDSLPGGRLGLAKDPLDPRFDSLADVDLQITAAEVERWKSVDELPVEASRLAGR